MNETEKRGLTEQEEQILRDVFMWENVSLDKTEYYDFINNDEVYLSGKYSRKQLLAFAVAMNTMQEFERKSKK